MKNKDTRNHVQTKQTLKKDEEEEEEKIYVYINSKKEMLTTARRFAFSRVYSSFSSTELPPAIISNSVGGSIVSPLSYELKVCC